MRQYIVLDLWLHTAVLLLAFGVDVVGLVQRSEASVATQVAFVVAQGVLGVYRLLVFLRRPTPETYAELRESQGRLIATLDIFSLVVFAAVDVLTLSHGPRSMV